VLGHVFQTTGLPDRANFSLCSAHTSLKGRSGGIEKTSTAFAIDSIEQQGNHTIEISIDGSPDKNIS